jgi:F0F1-type ATP synthase delta subunit
VVLTKEDLMTFLEEVQILKDSLFQSGPQAFELALADKVRSKIGPAITADLKDFPGDKQEYLQEIGEYMEGLPQIELTIGYEPTPEAVTRMVQYLRTLAGKPVTVSLLVSPAIMGGATIVSDGNFRDYSLGMRLQVLFGEMFGDGAEIKTADSPVSPGS